VNLLDVSFVMEVPPELLHLIIDQDETQLAFHFSFTKLYGIAKTESEIAHVITPLMNLLDQSSVMKV
jgi:hypothetical protein